jgi:hypothetical protein
MVNKRVVIEVGKPFPSNLHVANGTEGFKLNLTSILPIEIIAIYPNPTAAEVYAAQRAELQVGLLDAGDHTFFLLLNLRHRDPIAGWADMPYAVGLLPPDYRPKPQATPQTGYAVNMALVDHQRIVRSLRVFSLTPKFSLEMDRLIAKQLAHIETFTPERHGAEIDAAYAKYPATSAMVKDASLIEIAGTKFPKS